MPEAIAASAPISPPPAAPHRQTPRSDASTVATMAACLVIADLRQTLDPRSDEAESLRRREAGLAASVNSGIDMIA